jgi:hypothetical protein
MQANVPVEVHGEVTNPTEGTVVQGVEVAVEGLDCCRGTCSSHGIWIFHWGEEAVGSDLLGESYPTYFTQCTYF